MINSFLLELIFTIFTGNSEMENQMNNEGSPTPTSQLLQEYEMHLRNTLAKGMDAESYSLHTFEALLTQSMENLGIFYFFCNNQDQLIQLSLYH